MSDIPDACACGRANDGFSESGTRFTATHTARVCETINRAEHIARTRLAVLCRWAAHSLAQAPSFDQVTDDERVIFGNRETYDAVIALVREHAEDTWQEWL